MLNGLQEIINCFLIYSNEVDHNRAFADARDGLKPGNRAIIYTMYKHGFKSTEPHRKSAKASGAVVGELWPHGDSGVYKSMVRMSQDWINNLPELEWLASTITAGFPNLNLSYNSRVFIKSS